MVVRQRCGLFSDNSDLLRTKVYRDEWGNSGILCDNIMLFRRKPRGIPCGRLPKDKA